MENSLTDNEVTKNHQVIVDGVIAANVDPDVFSDKLIEWVESNGWTFTGRVANWFIEVDNTES